MLNLLKEMSLVPKGLRYKTMIAFSLMSLIPILVCAWLILTYIFPNLNLFAELSLGNISFILFISVIISLLGFYLTKEMIDPVIKMAGEAKAIASGDTNRNIEIIREDEVGDLSKSLNTMNQKIKQNIEELKLLGDKTKLINMEINKKVLALSGLLQIGDLISSSTDFTGIINFILRKVSEIESNAVSFLLLLDEEAKEYKVASSWNLDEAKVSSLKFKESETALSGLDEKIGIENIASVPVVAGGRLYGMLIVGNNKQGFVFAEDAKELLKVFAKQISIAIENSLLIKKSKELAIKDELTGLYNQNYMKTRLDEEIKRAIIYQRPCGYLLIDVDDFKNFYTVNGVIKSEAFLRRIGIILKESVSEVDRVGKLTEDRFAIILPEKNKRQSANIAEDLRKKIEKCAEKLTVSIGVSENPIDGSTAGELMQKAEKLMRTAKSLGKNRVSV